MRAGVRAVPDQDQGKGGFTLVELLVALALLGFIGAALFGSLRYGITAWGRGVVHANKIESLTFAQNLLRRFIADSYPLFLTGDPTRKHVDFDGSTRSMTFLAPVPIALGSGGRARITLSASSGAGGRTDLVMASTPELGNVQNASVTLAQVLISGATMVEFSYFGRSRSEQNPQWHATWDGEPALPNLVRLRLGFPAGDVRTWPELIVAPRITADVGCIYDALTRQCRGR
jgi:general secretion pathway protein J